MPFSLFTAVTALSICLATNARATTYQCPATVAAAANLAVQWQLSGRNHPQLSGCLSNSQFTSVIDYPHDPSMDSTPEEFVPVSGGSPSVSSVRQFRDQSLYEVVYTIGVKTGSIILRYDPRLTGFGVPCIGILGTTSEKIILSSCVPGPII